MELPPGVVNSCPGVLQGPSAQIFLQLINTLMVAQCDLGPEGRYPLDYGPKLKDGDEFDFIVVGSGSAGSVVASRLSEVPHWRVLLLEAGGYPSAASEVPGFGYTLQDTEEDWQYQMESSKTCCLSLKNNKCRCPRGKGLGGSSLLNVMQYTRSTKYDHDLWTQLGNVGWDYDSVTKYYKNFENAHIPDNQHYGNSGELHLTRYTSTQPIRRILENAYEELGYAGYTEDNPIGFRDNLVSIYKGTRQNSAKAFLTPAISRKNLFVAIHADVSRVLIHEDNLEVQGVEVRVKDKLMTLKVKNEVILSAGAINSPRILMHSGVGPKQHLSELGIKVVKHLQVGNNLQEHASLPVVAVKIDHSIVHPEMPLYMLDQLYKFFMNREGELAEVGITNFQASVNTYNQTHRGNVQFFHKLVRKQDLFLLKNVIRVKGLPNDVAETLIEHNQHSPLLIFIPMILNPKSRGFVRLKNSDPFSSPLIFPNLFGDERKKDLEVMIDAIKVVHALIKTKPFAPLNPKMVDLNLASCKEFEPQSDDFWKCAATNIASTSFHPVGTCKMGPSTDPAAVVNPRLQVYGIKGVRVIDASIMPEIVSSNPNGPIMMIGEKGAAFIKENWLKEHDEF